MPRLDDRTLTAADPNHQLAAAENEYGAAFKRLITAVLQLGTAEQRAEIGRLAFDLAQAEANLQVAREQDYILRVCQDPLG